MKVLDSKSSSKSRETDNYINSKMINCFPISPRYVYLSSNDSTKSNPTPRDLL